MTSNIASPAFDLLALTAREREMFDAGYRSGYGHGLERGRELRKDEETAAWQKMAARIRRVASEPTFSQLCERRGEHERAEAARVIERRLGVAS